MWLEDADTRAIADLWAEFPELDDRVREALRSYAKNTQLALRADWRRWRTWCLSQTPPRQLLPTQTADVIAFAIACSPEPVTDERGLMSPSGTPSSGRIRAASTLRRYLHTLSSMHRLARLPDPTKDPDIAAVRRRITRGRGAMRQKTGLNRPVLDDLLKLLSDSLWDKRARAMLPTAYCTLARSAELVALRIEDLAAGERGDGYALIRTSKSDQEGLGSHLSVVSTLKRCRFS